MTHFRRYEFKKRRYCSTPAVANLHDFSDHFVEALKNKIKLEVGSENNGQNSTGKWMQVSHAINEVDEEELDQMLTNGAHIGEDDYPTGGGGGDNIQVKENEQPASRKKFDHSINLQIDKAQNQANQNNGTADTKNGPVFKSANWLSDSELIFSLTNQVGGLVRALRIFQELDIGIKHVESRKSKRRESEFEIFVDIDCSDHEKMKKLVHHLR